MEKTVELTKAECQAIHEIIDQLSGSNPEYIFAWDGTDDINAPIISAAVKIYRLAGYSVPTEFKRGK